MLPNDLHVTNAITMSNLSNIRGMKQLIQQAADGSVAWPVIHPTIARVAFGVNHTHSLDRDFSRASY